MTESYVGSENEVFSLLKIGNENRAIGVTDMNSQSSRSHSVFILQIEQKNINDFSKRTGKIYLVDLAGSERLSKTGVTGMGLTEAQNINKSLTTLGLVIFKLTDGKSTHVPYRDSKLTHVLQESLGGNSRTSLIVTCSPSIFNEQETISTLKFGQRAKQIKNNAKVNKELSIPELKHMLKEAEKEILVKNKTIKNLEDYITLLESKLTGQEGFDLEVIREARENLKMKITEAVVEGSHETNTDTQTVKDEQDSQVSESDDETYSKQEVDDQVSGLGSILEGSLLSTQTLDSALQKIEGLPIKEELEVIEEDDEIQMPVSRSRTVADSHDIKMQNFEKEEQKQTSSPKNHQEKKQFHSIATGPDSITPEKQLEDKVKDLQPIEEESNQSFDENDLLDTNGNFIIFAPEHAEDNINEV